MRRFPITNYFLLLCLAGCASIAPLLSTPTPVPVSKATSTPRPVSTQTTPAISKPRILRVWLPPRFDPNADNASAKLLKQRFLDFESKHPGLEIEIRIKAEEGETSLLNSLSITSIAAPAALPNLIALPRPALEAAALKGLLHPIDGLTSILHDPDWFAYARELGYIQNTGYGLPFAGNATVLVYRAEFGELNSWNDILASKGRLVFPAGDPQGLTGLSLYVSAGGTLLNDQGLPMLDEDTFVSVLSLFEKGVANGVFPPSLANITTDDQALQAYRSGNMNILLTWNLSYSRALDGLMMPMPGLNQAPHSFATGWLWCLSGSNAENQQPAVELAEDLVAGEFIGEWANGLGGYLPARPSAIREHDVNIASIIESTQPIPTDDVLSVLGPIMHDALIRVLNGEQAEAVARSVLEQLK